ncbi:MAG: CpsB/CapC family capsule biosynthesis tyrosine phosphatase [Kofleriaceae bacterium]
MSYVDLHSHVLFGLDDGSPDLATSRAMLDGLASLGFAEVCATPHQKAGQFLPAWADVEATYAALRATGEHPTLRLAAENMWDDVFFGRLTAGEIPSYDGGPAYLVELRPSAMPVGLEDQLFRQRVAGRLPVLAHPERYSALWDDEALLLRLREHCAFTVDLGALAGAHGRREAKAARRYVEEGLAHAVASDAHSVADVALAAEGIAWIRKRCGEAAVTRLLDTHPRAILAGELPS